MRKRLRFFKCRYNNETNIYIICIENDLVKLRKIVRRVFPTLYVLII